MCLSEDPGTKILDQYKNKKSSGVKDLCEWRVWREREVKDSCTRSSVHEREKSWLNNREEDLVVSYR